jgi:repressor LexA
MADDLTSRQQEILDFIRNSLEVFSVPPTRAEIASAFGFASPNAAEDHLRALAKKGAITLEPGSARGIRLVEQLGLPLIGIVAAGSPLLAVENRLGQLRIDPALFTPRADFLLRVRGLSMIEAGIRMAPARRIALPKRRTARSSSPASATSHRQALPGAAPWSN